MEDVQERFHVAIYRAVESDCPDRLRQLLNDGANVNEVYTDQSLISTKSILHIACEKGRIDCVRVLLDKGTHSSPRDPWGQTPLMSCMLSQYPDIAELLLSRDQDMVDTGDKYGKTALHIASESGSLECVEVLLQNEATVNILTEFGVSPLMLACTKSDVDQSATLEIIRALLDKGADCNMKCFRNRRSALQMAVLAKHVQAVELLLSVGADPSSMDSGGRTPLTNLMWEFCRNVKDADDIDPDVMTIIVMLIQAGSDLNLCKYEHSNALSMATTLRCSFLVKYFLYNGADQTKDFYCGITPLIIAAHLQDIDTVKALLDWYSDLHRKGRVYNRQLQYYCQSDAFCLAIERGAFDIATLLCESGYDVSRVDYLRDPSLIPPAALQQNPTVLEYFRYKASTAQSLFQASVVCLRRVLRGDISNKASLLPLPRLMIEAVKLKGQLE